jgi:ABC-2 type transport system ATP-binding protein
MIVAARPRPNVKGSAGGVDVVVLDGVSRSFGTVHAVSGLTLRLQRGESVALLGPNGAGKTTTISLLLGLLTPDQGRVRLLGTDPADAVAAGRVGVMLQDGGLMRGVRVGELLDMLRRQYTSPLSLERVIDLAQLHGLRERLVHRLSGGETQRLRLAVALIGDPELLVLDEPTAAMDVEARRAFWAEMANQATRGRSVLFSTHYLEEADEHADRVLVLAAGRLMADGSPAAIKASVGTRAVRCTIDQGSGGLDRLPGVTSVREEGGRVELLSRDTDATLRALVAHYPGAHDIDVGGIGLEEAFLALSATAA